MLTSQKFNLQAALRSGILIPVLILAGGAAGYFLIYPKFISLSKARAGFETKQEEIVKLRQQQEEAKKLLLNYERKKEQLVSIDQALPRSPQIPELLAALDYFAVQGGVKISNLQLSSPSLQDIGLNPASSETPKRIDDFTRAVKDVGIIALDVSFKGQYPNLKTFLLNLEQSLRIFDVYFVLLGSVETKTGEGQEFTIRAHTYYQK